VHTRSGGFRLQPWQWERGFRVRALDDLFRVGFDLRSDSFEECSLFGVLELAEDRKRFRGQPGCAVDIVLARGIKRGFNLFSRFRTKGAERISAGRCELRSDERLAENVHFKFLSYRVACRISVLACWGRVRTACWI